MKIALTGGIACGKSLVAKYLNELSVKTIDADDIVHELIPDPNERKRLAAEVFANPEKRKELEAKIHPFVKEKINDFFEISKSRNPEISTHSTLNTQLSTLNSQLSTFKIAIIPLLFEVHWDKEYDIICSVVSDREKQISRMMTTRGYTREEAEARLAAQMPVKEKAEKSNYVIENNGSSEELKFKVVAFVEWLKGRFEEKIHTSNQ